MLKLFLWLRYLRKKKIVLLSIAAVALSVTLLIVVDSLFTGFIEALKKHYIAEAGDISLWSRQAIPKYNVLLDRLEKLDGVEAAAPISFGGGLLRLESGDVREVMIQGIEPQREQGFTDWKESLLSRQTATGPLGFEVSGYPDDIGGWLGINIVAEPDEETDEYDREEVRRLIGKQVVLTTYGQVKVKSQNEEQKTNYKPKRRVLKLRVADIAFTRTFYGDMTLYLPFEKFNKLRFGDDQAGHTHRIKIKLSDKADAVAMKTVISRVFEQFAQQQLGFSAEVIAQTRIIIIVQELNDEYFAELRKQMAVLLLIFAVICSVAVLLIFCIFYMIVETRQKDIAIIKSCGAASSSAALIFVGFGGCVGVAGSGLGIIFGYIVTSNINTLEQWVRIIFGLKLWRSSSYIFNAIPDQVNWLAVWPIVLVATAACVLGALIPAIVAARVEPVKILRYE